jgi:hypothetical protein
LAECHEDEEGGKAVLFRIFHAPLLLFWLKNAAFGRKHHRIRVPVGGNRIGGMKEITSEVSFTS